jgi:hypothetical protein
MILQRGEIVLIYVLFQDFQTFIRDIGADAFQKTELRIQNAPPVVAASTAEDDPHRIIVPAGKTQPCVCTRRKIIMHQRKLCAVRKSAARKQLIRRLFETGAVLPDPADRFAFAAAGWQTVTQTVQNQTADFQLDGLIFSFVTVGQNVKTQDRR